MKTKAQLRILVIEDSPNTRNVIANLYLHDLGYGNVVTASDGASAWQWISSAKVSGAPFDLILSDVHLPKMNGIELLDKVRSHSRTADIPFILMAAHCDRQTIESSIRAGVNAFILRPCTPEVLDLKILTALRQVRSRKVPMQLPRHRSAVSNSTTST